MTKDDHWMEKAVPKSHKGKLHRALKVPMGEKIPEKKLDKAEHSKSKTLREEANLAQTYAKYRNMKK